jgi:hypothetical protein
MLLSDLIFPVVFMAAVSLLVAISPLARNACRDVICETRLSLWAELVSMAAFLAMIALWAEIATGKL